MLAALLAAIGLAACGGGSSASTSTGATEAASSPSTATMPGPESSGGASHPSQPAGSGSAGTGSGGGADAFRVHGADNSIPDYGAEASAAERAAAGAALAAYLKAYAKGEWSKACPYIATSLRSSLQRLASGSKQLTGAGCAKTLATLSAAAPAGTRADPLIGGPAALRVKGDNAFALFYGAHNQQYMMPMASEGGDWKVTQIAPVTYPPGASSGGG